MLIFFILGYLENSHIIEVFLWKINEKISSESYVSETDLTSSSKGNFITDFL